MPLDPKARAAYVQSYDVIDDVLEDFNATPEQVEEAQKALRAITTARIDHAVNGITDRTAFLNTLTARLKAVKNSVRPNPIGNVLSKITGAVATVNAALAQGK